MTGHLDRARGRTGDAPPAWLATSPHGQLPVASWHCRRAKCPAGIPEALREPGDSRDDIRAAAMAHLSETGHPVRFTRGTAEDFEPLATGRRADQTSTVVEIRVYPPGCDLPGCYAHYPPGRNLAADGCTCPAWFDGGGWHIYEANPRCGIHSVTGGES